MQQIPTTNITSIINQVSFPAFSLIQDQNKRLKNGYKKTIEAISYLSFPLMIGIIVIAKPLIRFILTDKWLPSVPYLQLLCILGLLYPLSAVNLSILKFKGRSDIFFYLEMIKIILIIIAIIITVKISVIALIIGQICAGFLGFILNIYFSGKFINYKLKEQLLDVLPYFLISLIMGIIVYFIGLANITNFIKLSIQIVSGFISYYMLSKIFGLNSFKEFKIIFKQNILMPLGSINK